MNKKTGFHDSFLRPRWSFASIQDGALHIEGMPVERLAQRYGTPFYMLVESEIRIRLRRFKTAFPYSNFKPQYAIKCNSNIEILKIVKEEGFEADASSVGEIILAMLAGFTPDQITLTNLYKSTNDIIFAARLGIKAMTIDSLEELGKAIKAAKGLDVPLKIFLRINPKIKFSDYTTLKHQYGISIDNAHEAIDNALAAENINLAGLHWHGAYVPNPEVYHEAMRRMMPLIKYAQTKGAAIEYLDLGGGFPVEYGDDHIFTPEGMGKEFVAELEKIKEELSLPNLTLVFEPGKFIVANAGIGVVKVVSVKELEDKKLAVVDGSTYAMLPDPLTWNCEYHTLPVNKMSMQPEEKYDICGCTCDYLDKIAKERKLPKLEEGDFLAVMDCGAYSNVMASNFNALKRPPIVMLKSDGTAQVVRRRDRYSDMFANELEVVKTDNNQQLKTIYNLIRQAAVKTPQEKVVVQKTEIN